jgi:hypothetical protein
VSFRWHWVLIAGAGALLALALAFCLRLEQIADSGYYLPPEAAQVRQLRMIVQDWKTEHPGAPAPDLTSPEVRRSLGPDLTFIDPWGTPYLVIFEPDEGRGEETVVLSFGPDHIRGTIDDLRVPQAYAESPPAADGGTAAPPPLPPASRPATR